MKEDVIVSVRIIQSTPVAVLVLPGEDREAAAWLRKADISIIGDTLDGKSRIRLSSSLASVRGLAASIEV